MQRYDYNSKTKFGAFLPYVIYQKKDFKKQIPFHISSEDFFRLKDAWGTGKVYGKTPWGPWLRLHVFRFIIIGIEKVEDPKVLDTLNIKERRFLEDPERIEIMKLIAEQFHRKE